MEQQQQIIELFNANIKDVKIPLDVMNQKHDGKEGYWLEDMMSISHNANNQPDILGYEMKKYSRKITLGDFSASEYAFSKPNERLNLNHANQWNDEMSISRSDFMRFFGSQKNNRYSWSGNCVPRYKKWNDNGQKLCISKNNDIFVYYSYKHDKRENKSVLLPDFIKHRDKIVIALWTWYHMKMCIENKFNQNGFFLCKKLGQTYNEILFGKPFNFEFFIESIKNKETIFDSGMYDGNSRNYSHFRCKPALLESLIIHPSHETSS